MSVNVPPLYKNPPKMPPSIPCLRLYPTIRPLSLILVGEVPRESESVMKVICPFWLYRKPPQQL